MSETSISGDSPEAVALRLLEFIAKAEQKALGSPGTTADKAWVLSTYKECLYAVQHPSPSMNIPDKAIAGSRSRE